MKKLFCVIFIGVMFIVSATGQNVPSQTATEPREAPVSPAWWEAAEARAQKVAALKKARHEAETTLRGQLYEEVQKEWEKDRSKSFDAVSEKVHQRAAPKVAAIKQKFDPPIAAALQEYLTFLDERNPAPQTSSNNTDSPVNQGIQTSLRPQILYKEKPRYSDAARQSRIQGTVVLSVVLQRDGKVTGIRVVRGLPDGLSDEAIKAAKEIIFLPGLKDGVPVSVRLMMEFSFNLI